MKKFKHEILNTLAEYAEEISKKGLKIYCIMLKGSQNYNLADEQSDYDANLIFIPTLQQLRSNEKYEFEFETGKVTCHNIYSFMDIVAKGNPQWIEVCHTPYFIGEPLTIFKHYKVNPSALKGMVMEKVNAFEKLYPSRKSVVEQYGYDPKQLHHIVRLYDLLMAGKPVVEYTGERRDWLIKVKRGLLTYEDAIKTRDQYVELLEGIYQEKKEQYKPQEVNYEQLDKIVVPYYRYMY